VGLLSCLDSADLWKAQSNKKMARQKLHKLPKKILINTPAFIRTWTSETRRLLETRHLFGTLHLIEVLRYPNQGWQVSANSGLNRGLNRPGRNRFLPVFTKHGTTTAALRLC